jgi:hypothetical protein
MSSAYSLEPNTFDLENLPPRYSGESDIQYYNRLQGQAVRFAFEHPTEVAKFISAHYFHNLVFSYIYLPHSFQIDGIKEYVRTESFWNNWQGNLSFQAQILLFINLSVLALGFGCLWKKYKYLAFVPVFLGIAYNISISIGRVSGWRFILPADWITLVYYALGIMQLYLMIHSFTNREVNPLPQEYHAPDIVQPLKGLAFAGLSVLFLALSLGLTRGHELFSQRYPPKSISQLKEDYVAFTGTMPSRVSGSQLDRLLKSDGAVIAYGQALNPSFLEADTEGLDESWPVYCIWPSYKPRPYSRLIFNLSGPTSAGVVLPMEAAPASFPDGAEVIVIGCWSEFNDINALAVLVQGTAPIHYISEPFHAPVCPLSAP